ncbi:2-oxoglutarate oxidoreductase [bacterium]|nr:2-oxoglutarate oxidoreductase [bacterium]
MKQEPVFVRTQGLKDAVTLYCAGCGHGVAHRLVAEVLEEMNALERTVAVAPVGCAVYGYDYWNFDTTEAAHGRTPAVASAIKRVLPDKLVMSYQGDGDLASIGMAEIIHAANRGEKITVIFINNTNYGMTGGQMAPTTLAGQITTTTPRGRDVDSAGAPMLMAEMLAALPGVAYSVRGALHKPGLVRKAKSYIRRAFEVQDANQGFSIVELLSLCPTNWGMNTLKAVDYMETEIMQVFPVGVFKDEQFREAASSHV